VLTGSLALQQMPSQPEMFAWLGELLLRRCTDAVR
jgi:hypothetical protein